MKNLPLLFCLLLFVLIFLASCEDGKACTLELRIFSVEVVDSAGNSVHLDSTYTLRKSNNQVLFSESYDSTGSPNPFGYVLIQDTELDDNETVRFGGLKNSVEIVSEDYEFFWDGCHLEKVSGPSTIVVP